MSTPARPLRIAVIGLTHPFRGGIAHYTTVLCRALGAKHTTQLFALKRQYPGLLFPGSTQLDNSDRPIEIDHQPCLDSLNPLSWFGTYRRIRDFQPDLLLISWWHPFLAPAFGSVARLCRRFARIPVCFLCHNALPHERSWIDNLLLRYAYSTAAAFIAHSQEDADNLQLFRPDADVRKNPHPAYDEFGADTAPTQAAAREELGLTGKRVLLFFGFIRAYKGLQYLLEAIEKLPVTDAYHLLVVGEFYEPPSDYPALARLVSENRLTLVDRYVANEEVPKYFAATDLLVAPYVTATQSGVIQIAYSFDVPVIATRVGGLPEVVDDGATGFLVSPRSSEALVTAIQGYYAADPATFRRGIETARHLYSWDRMVSTVEAVAEAVQNPPP